MSLPERLQPLLDKMRSQAIAEINDTKTLDELHAVYRKWMKKPHGIFPRFQRKLWEHINNESN